MSTEQWANVGQWLVGFFALFGLIMLLHYASRGFTTRSDKEV